MNSIVAEWASDARQTRAAHLIVLAEIFDRTVDALSVCEGK